MIMLAVSNMIIDWSISSVESFAKYNDMMAFALIVMHSRGKWKMIAKMLQIAI